MPWILDASRIIRKVQFMKHYRGGAGCTVLRRTAVVAVLLAMGVLAVGVPAAGASEGGIYLSCARSTGQGSAPKHHPRNCMVSASALSQHGGDFLLLNFQQISWRAWGAGVAWAEGVAVNEIEHTRTYVRFAVSGRQTCDARSYYATMVLMGPKRVYPHPVSLKLGCG